MSLIFDRSFVFLPRLAPPNDVKFLRNSSSLRSIDSSEFGESLLMIDADAIAARMTTTTQISLMFIHETFTSLTLPLHVLEM